MIQYFRNRLTSATRGFRGAAAKSVSLHLKAIDAGENTYKL